LWRESWRASRNEKRESDGLAPIDYEELYNVSTDNEASRPPKRKITSSKKRSIDLDEAKSDVQASRPPKRRKKS